VRTQQRANTATTRKKAGTTRQSTLRGRFGVAGREVPTFPFEQTSEAMASVEQGRTKAGKVVVTMHSAPDAGPATD
jgi:hypothetical protein